MFIKANDRALNENIKSSQSQSLHTWKKRWANEGHSKAYPTNLVRPRYPSFNWTGWEISRSKIQVPILKQVQHRIKQKLTLPSQNFTLLISQIIKQIIAQAKFPGAINSTAKIKQISIKSKWKHTNEPKPNRSRNRSKTCETKP